MNGAPKSHLLPANSMKDSLAQSRQENARLMNLVRCGLLTGFLALYGIGILFLNVPGFRESWWLLAADVAAAFALWAAGRKFPSVLNLSRFAVPLLDMPFVTLIQHVNLTKNPFPEAMGIYALALFGMLTTMSSFSMRSVHLFACAAMGTACVYTLYARLELTAVSYLAAPLLLFVTAWMMSYLPKRQIQLIRDAAERKARRDRLARYFSPGVAELIEARDEPGEGEMCELSVLFCDIRGFTEISESLGAREVVRMLNEFHGVMVETIFRFGGTLDKYLGDGLLAYFNAPVRQPDHARRAVCCALAMIESLEELNRKRREIGAAPIRIGIGVHTGQAIVGNIGADHRREFTAVGDTVNVGSRLQELTKKFQEEIIVSEAVVAGSGAENELKFESHGAIEVRGRKQGIEVFSPRLRNSA